MKRFSTHLLAVLGFLLVPALGAAVVPGSASGASSVSSPEKLWQQLLKAHVTPQGWVDYEGMQRDRELLDGYLEYFKRTRPDSMERPLALAYLINAYNAYTVASVLQFYPIGSVKEVRGFFTRRVHRIGGRKLSLDDIEKWARGFGDPRVHFALNCASRSCPKLQRFVYRGDSLDVQLDRAARQFLSDPKRGMRIDREKGVIYLSRLFKWYGGDFAKEGGRANYLELALGFLDSSKGLNYVKRHYLSDEDRRFVETQRPKVVHMKYDWTLNRIPSSSSSSDATLH